MAKTLKQKAASGMVWTALQKYSTLIIQFVSGIILARLLTPYDYGCIGMLSIFMVLAGTFIDGGFGSALIQKKQPTQTDYSTIFFWNMGMSILMYIILYIGAPTIARFYNIPLLSSVLRIQGLVLIINAFNIIQSNQLRKKINFKAIAIVSITTSIISLTATIWMAYNGFGVWSLVAQNLISSVITVVSFWFYVKWRPTWTFSRQSFRELFSFGFYMFLTHLINNFCRKIPGLLIGKVFSPITLGYYSKGIRTENLASHGISSVMTQVTYPLYAQVQDNKAVLSNMIRRLTMTISYITFPLMAALMLTAKPLFILLYSDRWVDSVPYFQIFCLVGLSDCLQSVNTQTIAAIGRSQIMLKWTLIKRTVGLSFIIGGLFGFGMKGLLAGMVIYNWFCYFVNIGLVSKYIGYKWKNQLSDLLPVTIVVFVSSLIAFIVAQVFHCSLYVDGLLKLIIFIAIYMSWSFIFKPESFTYSLTIIPNKLQFWKRF